MENTTMTMNAASCVLSVRPRPATQVLTADIHAQGQGTTVSIASGWLLLAVLDAPFTGVVSAAAFRRPNYKTSDVARSPWGRPPV